jgi:hypothetical protein
MYARRLSTLPAILRLSTLPREMELGGEGFPPRPMFCIAPSVLALLWPDETGGVSGKPLRFELLRLFPYGGYAPMGDHSLPSVDMGGEDKGATAAFIAPPHTILSHRYAFNLVGRSYLFGSGLLTQNVEISAPAVWNWWLEVCVKQA